MRVPSSRLRIDIPHVASNGQYGLDISFLPAPSLASSLLLLISLSDYPLDTFTPPPALTLFPLPAPTLDCASPSHLLFFLPVSLPLHLAVSSPLPFQTPSHSSDVNSILTSPEKPSWTPTCGEVPWR